MIQPRPSLKTVTKCKRSPKFKNTDPKKDGQPLLTSESGVPRCDSELEFYRCRFSNTPPPHTNISVYLERSCNLLPESMCNHCGTCASWRAWDSLAALLWLWVFSLIYFWLQNICHPPGFDLQMIVRLFIKNTKEKWEENQRKLGSVPEVKCNIVVFHKEINENTITVVVWL